MTNKENLLELAENVPKVYESGKKVGIEEGKKAEYDAFWDTYQANGTRVNYGNAFGGVGWTDELFKPKYDMKPTDAYMMFRGTGITNIADLSVSLDFANTTNAQYMFQWASIQHIGVIDMRKTTNTVGMFAYCYSLRKIDKLIFKDDGTQKITSDMFTSDSSLEDIVIEGVIGTNGFNVQWSTKLNKASIESVINALSADTSGLTLTLSKTAVNNAFGINVDDASTYPEGSEYYILRQSKSNWNIYYYE